MSTTQHGHGTDGSRSNPHVRYETADIEGSPVMRSAVYLFIILTVVLALLWFYFGFLTRREAAAQPPPQPIAFPADRRPPLPNLLTDEPKNLREFREAEDVLLHSSGTVDPAPAAGGEAVMRIPIDDAIRIVAKRGLPSRGASSSSPSLSPSPSPSATPSPAKASH
jgi:hypothetical protein